MSRTLIYKIVTEPQWREAERTGVFAGAPIDHKDGFIHLSAAHQVADTARLHFAGQTDLLIAAVDVDLAGGALKWEASRGGDLFPHLYASLPLSAVAFVRPLPWNGTAHDLPPPLED